MTSARAVEPRDHADGGGRRADLIAHHTLLVSPGPAMIRLTDRPSTRGRPSAARCLRSRRPSIVGGRVIDSRGHRFGLESRAGLRVAVPTARAPRRRCGRLVPAGPLGDRTAAPPVARRSWNCRLTTWPAYQLIRALGRGGMGTVFSQTSLFGGYSLGMTVEKDAGATRIARHREGARAKRQELRWRETRQHPQTGEDDHRDGETAGLSPNAAKALCPIGSRVAIKDDA